MTTPANQPDLIAWLRAQLDDDERIALAVADHRQRAGELRWVDAKRRILDSYADAIHMERATDETGDDAKWDWLFKREALEGVVKLLALPYADRPGYRDEWRP